MLVLNAKIEVENIYDNTRGTVEEVAAAGTDLPALLLR